MLLLILTADVAPVDGPVAPELARVAVVVVVVCTSTLVGLPNMILTVKQNIKGMILILLIVVWFKYISGGQTTAC